MSEATIEKMQTEVKKIFEPTIIKIECENGDKVLYSEEGNLGNFITIPNGYEGKVKIFLSDKSETFIDISVLRNILNNDISKSQSEKYPHIEKIKEILENDIDKLQTLDYGFGELTTYNDITDYEFNNFEKIEKTNLISSGLWIGNGIRKLELDFDEEFDKFISDARKKRENEDRKISIEAYFNEKNNDKLAEPISFSGQKIGTDFYILLDTDKLSQYFDEIDTAHSFYGHIEISIRKEERDNVDYSFKFPFEIKMLNPIHKEIHAKTEEVSIDFGTSSTCVAYDKGKKLLSFNDSPKDINDYENMTALIIYNWRSIYNVWKVENKTIPALKRSKNEAHKINIRNDYFDYSDKIKEELEEAPESKTIDAIIMKLKSLPASFENDKNYSEDVRPFDDWKKQVYLTDKIEDEDEETLNPIALYGYLIGRSLNKQVGNKIYSKYNLTMPVNFSQYKKDRIIESLEYGLKRSLPSAIKKDLELKNDYPESVAILGAAKKLKYLKSENGKDASLFAVFDFGGGTLDFAFGLYRKASDKEDLSVFENEDNQYKNIIEIFKTDGELVGGETLIESLSWEIYKKNKELMEENDIPIFVPEHEEKLQNYPQKLLGIRHVDHVNLKSFNERFSRDFFINTKFGEDKDKIKLFTLTGELGIEFENFELSEADADDFLEKEILKLVANFRNVLTTTFMDNEDRLKQFGFDKFDINDIKIIQAGNACKAKWVKSAFDEEFKEHENIIFINDEDKEITPKNAVAKGALMLNSVGVYNHSVVEGAEHLMPLDRYIWDIDMLEEDAEEAEPIFKRGDNVTIDFSSIGKRKGTEFTVYFSSTSSLEDEDDEDLKYHIIAIPEELIEDDKYDIWAKPYDADKIECILANNKGENMNETKKMIISLENGEVVK